MAAVSTHSSATSASNSAVSSRAPLPQPTHKDSTSLSLYPDVDRVLQLLVKPAALPIAPDNRKCVDDFVSSASTLLSTVSLPSTQSSVSSSPSSQDTIPSFFSNFLHQLNLYTIFVRLTTCKLGLIIIKILILCFFVYVSVCMRSCREQVNHFEQFCSQLPASIYVVHVSKQFHFLMFSHTFEGI